MAQIQPSTKVKQSPYNIQYLSFQGGGGKGLAYLGALKWLESYPQSASASRVAPLPLYNGQPAGNSIIGVSGASAGAITALLVALGYGWQTIQANTQNLDLIDPVQIGVYRSVPAGIVTPPMTYASLVDSLPSEGTLLAYLMKIPALKQFMQPILSVLGKFGINSTTVELVTNVGYSLALLNDGGMISGAKLLSFLQQQIASAPVLNGQTKSGLQASQSVNGAAVTFGQLYKWTKPVLLAVVSTNLTTGRPMVFSYYTTPDFPVADAVAMSASFPFLFKPVWLSAKQSLGGTAKKPDFVGWYADGGLTNNIPIHVFDELPVFQADPTLTSSVINSPDTFKPFLSQGMLGLRLATGSAPQSSTSSLPPDPQSGSITPGKMTPFIWDVASNVTGALQYGSNDGQLRDVYERNQTVIIYADGLSLTDFSPSQASLTTAIDNGYNAMAAYYI